MILGKEVGGGGRERNRERQRENERDVRNTHLLVASRTLHDQDWELNLQPRYMSLTWNQT